MRVELLDKTQHFKSLTFEFRSEMQKKVNHQPQNIVVNNGILFAGYALILPER